MQPWKISVGFTAIILAVAAMVGGERFAYLKPHLQIHRRRLLDASSVVWRTCRSLADGCDLRRRPRFGLG